MEEKLISDIDGYKELPEGYRVASLDDFHVKGRKKIGMKYLIKGFHSGLYYPRAVDESLTAAKILPWINAGHVFIKSSQHES